jgi:hypothetical protein
MERRDQPRPRRAEELDRRDDRPPQPGPAERVFALQRRAGNYALSARLARAPDTAKPKEKEHEGSDRAGGSGARATLPGVGTIPLLSVSFGETGRGVGGSARREEHRSPSLREMVFSSSAGGHSAQLLKASVEGKPMEVDVVIPSGTFTLRFKLKGALVSNYRPSSSGSNPTESWTLNFESFEQSTEGDAGE